MKATEARKTFKEIRLTGELLRQGVAEARLWVTEGRQWYTTIKARARRRAAAKASGVSVSQVQDAEEVSTP